MSTFTVRLSTSSSRTAPTRPKGRVRARVDDVSIEEEVGDPRRRLRKLRVLDEFMRNAGERMQLGRHVCFAKKLEELLAKFSGTLDKLNAGQGTVGQFLVNQQLYQSLNGATREFQDLAKDIRANPKKFLRIKLALF